MRVEKPVIASMYGMNRFFFKTDSDIYGHRWSQIDQNKKFLFNFLFNVLRPQKTLDTSKRLHQNKTRITGNVDKGTFAGGGGVVQGLWVTSQLGHFTA